MVMEFKRKYQEGTDFVASKKRRLIADTVPMVETSSSQVTVTTTMPTAVIFSNSPQEMVYAVLTGEKCIYSKQDVLTLINKLVSLYPDRFSGDCSYIS